MLALTQQKLNLIFCSYVANQTWFRCAAYFETIYCQILCSMSHRCLRLLEMIVAVIGTTRAQRCVLFACKNSTLFAPIIREATCVGCPERQLARKIRWQVEYHSNKLYLRIVLAIYSVNWWKAKAAGFAGFALLEAATKRMPGRTHHHACNTLKQAKLMKFNKK